MDTALYDLSIPVISRLQDTLSGQDTFLRTISTTFDPKYAFLVYSPLAYLLDPKVGKLVIMTTVIAEWLNQVLKWLLHGERPYWYVHSSGHFDPQQTPIKQFPITCELGPGHPSGHSMVTAAVWYIILSSLLRAYKSHQQSQITATGDRRTTADKSTQVATITTWALYLVVLATVAVSRVFLGCHFPHQCVAGAALGALLANWISRQHIKPSHYLAASLLLFTTAFGTFGLLQSLGFDPDWTIRLATKHCVKREYIHLDTAPFFSIMRYCGFALGCGLGLMFPVTKTTDVAQQQPAEGQEILLVAELKDAVTGKQSLYNRLASNNLMWLSFKLATVTIMARLVDNLALFVSPINLIPYYSSAFAAYALFSYCFINL